MKNSGDLKIFEIYIMNNAGDWLKIRELPLLFQYKFLKSDLFWKNYFWKKLSS